MHDNRKEAEAVRFPPRVNPKWLRLKWSEPLGFPEKPYAKRWVAEFGRFSVRLHHWFSSDDERAPHDHSWWFWTAILAGRYIDHSDEGSEVMFPGKVRFRPADHRHWVEIPSGKKCWTLLVTGPFVRPFGFWVTPTKRLKANKYFFTHGHHSPDGGQPRRTRKLKEGKSESIVR